MTMDSATGEIVSGPDVVSRGFVYVRESENLMDDIKQLLRAEIEKLKGKLVVIDIKDILKIMGYDV